MHPSFEPNSPGDPGKGAPVLPASKPAPVQTAASTSGGFYLTPPPPPDPPELGMTVTTTVTSIGLEKRNALRGHLRAIDPTCPPDISDDMDDLAERWLAATGEDIQAEAIGVEARALGWKANKELEVTRLVVGREWEPLRTLYLARVLGATAAHGAEWLNRIDPDGAILDSLKRDEFEDAYGEFLGEADRVTLLGLYAHFTITRALNAKSLMSDLDEELLRIGEIEGREYFPARGHEVLALSEEARNAFMANDMVRVREITQTLADRAVTDPIACLRLVHALDANMGYSSECLDDAITRQGVAAWLELESRSYSHRKFLEEVDAVAVSLSTSIFGPTTTSDGHHYRPGFLLEHRGNDFVSRMEWCDREPQRLETVRALYKKAGISALGTWDDGVLGWLPDDEAEGPVARGALVAVDAAMSSFEELVEKSGKEEDLRHDSEHPYKLAMKALFRASQSSNVEGVVALAKTLSDHLVTAARLHIRW